MPLPTETVSLPSNPNVQVIIHRLTWLQKRAARQLSVQESARGLKEMGGAETARAIRELQDDLIDAENQVPPEPAPDAWLDDVVRGHDPLTVLVSGIDTVVPGPPDLRVWIDELEPEDAEFLQRRILRLTVKPPEANAEGNASGPSTAS